MGSARSGARRKGRSPLVAGMVALAIVVSSCSLTDNEVPYAGLPPAPAAETVLEDLNLASLGLRAYPCDLFDAPVSRCYRPDHWLSIREGRETLAYIHRELLAAGARYWGGADAATHGDAPTTSGLDLGCYYDYETLDHNLRLAIVGPTGEASPCANGLPGDGVSEVWIVGADFEVGDVYREVQMPPSLEALLTSLPTEPEPVAGVYGGENSGIDGYYGPELPQKGDGYGVRILPETVAVHGGVARGLVQYRGAAALAGDGGPERATSGAVGIVVAAGTSQYAVPIVVRPGESAPFEVELPDGFDEGDLEVVPGWQHVEDPWLGAQLLVAPAPDSHCADGLTLDGAPIVGLQPGRGEACLTAAAQLTTQGGQQVFVDAMVAVFDTDGTVLDVVRPYVSRSDSSLTDLGRIATLGLDIDVAWVAAAGSADGTGLWVRFIRAPDFSNGGTTDPAALAASVG